jgi:Domain of unknown function (DUF2431)
MVRKRPLVAITTDDTSRPPIRDCTRLFAVAETVKCAFLKSCIPCAYKIAAFDVALDSEFCLQVPNQRPELCPRSQNTCHSNSRTDIPPLGYKRGMSVLTVGDGDFSFSVALARFGCNVVATSYESKETLLEVYNSVHVVDNMAELESLGAKMFFNVDGTDLQETLFPSLANQKFHRIIWNFPCSAVAKGQDGQNIEMEFNKKLVNDFMKSAQHFSIKHGQIFICHKTKPPFNQWNIEEVAVSNTPVAAVRYSNRVVLDRYLFPPYVPRKALDRKSFPCHDACMYIFEVLESSTKDTLSKSDEGINCLDTLELSDINFLEKIGSSKLIRVTPDLIRALREQILQNLPPKRDASPAKRKRK